MYHRGLGRAVTAQLQRAAKALKGPLFAFYGLPGRRPLLGPRKKPSFVGRGIRPEGSIQLSEGFRPEGSDALNSVEFHQLDFMLWPHSWNHTKIKRNETTYNLRCSVH